MKTILTALREKGKVTDESARTIARALGGSTIASAVSPEKEEESGKHTDKPSGKTEG